MSQSMHVNRYLWRMTGNIAVWCAEMGRQEPGSVQSEYQVIGKPEEFSLVNPDFPSAAIT